MWDFSKIRTEISETKRFLKTEKLIIGAIKLYHIVLSEQQTDACNFTPSCSHYAYRAIKKEGVFWGSLMAIDRLERCNPWAWQYLNEYYKVKWTEERGFKLYDPPERIR